MYLKFSTFNFVVCDIGCGFDGLNVPHLTGTAAEAAKVNKRCKR